MARQSFLLALGLVVTGVAVMSMSHSAHACVCGAIEPDAAYQRALLVFTGSVEKVTHLTREEVKDGNKVPIVEGFVARLSVEEYFKGTGGTEIELRGGNTSCDIGFEAGKRYIVYASRNEQTGTLGAFSCSRTGPLNEYTKPDISYLQRALRGERPTMIYGFVFRTTGESKSGESEPLGELAVTLEGEGKRLEIKTDRSGYFETFDLQPGSYRVRTGVTGKLRGAEEKTVEIMYGGVASMVFRTTTMGALNGRVVDQEGQPVGEISVQLLLAEGPKSGSITQYLPTGEDGRFTFGEIPAGRYALAINSEGRRSLYSAPFLPSYFPNASTNVDAQVITITDGVMVELGDFILQKRYPTVAVRGVVVTPDDKPVPGAYVYLDKSGGEWDAARSVQTDAGGRFVHQAFEGITYTVRANADSPTGGILESEHVKVMALKSATPVRLVVRLQR